MTAPSLITEMTSAAFSQHLTHSHVYINGGTHRTGIPLLVEKGSISVYRIFTAGREHFRHGPDWKGFPLLQA